MASKRKKWDGDIFDDPKMIVARNKVIAALEQCPAGLQPYLFAKLRGIRACGEFAVTFLVSHSGQVTGFRRNQCRCRGCAVCDSLLASRTRHALKLIFEERAAAGARFSLLTLTLPHKRSDAAKKTVGWLFEAVKRFQRSRGFGRHVKGWVRGFEVPWSEENGFHPHAHYLIESDFWPMEEIKALWTRNMLAAGGPHVPAHGTHIKGIEDAGSGLMEAVGYPFKIPDLAKMPPAELCELLSATRCRHLTQLCRKWSKRRKVLLEEAEATTARLQEADGSIRLTLRELGAQVKAGDRAAFDIMVQGAGRLVENWATVGVGIRLLHGLRTSAAINGWPLPELPDEKLVAMRLAVSGHKPL